MSLKIDNLVKYYKDQAALGGISFQASPGAIVGFLGPNGAGKSTTMKIASGFVNATSGTAEVCGFDVSQKPLDVKKHLGYLPEHNPLYPELYVREYISFVGSLHGMKGKSLQQAVAEMIEKTGLTPESHKKIGQLSKGYRQRVGLAAAMVHNPDVLILDEPTTGLDPNQIVEIRQLIKQLGKEKTVVFSTHIMQEVQQICDRVVIINQGKIVADADLATLSKGSQVSYSVRFETEIDSTLLQQMHGVAQVQYLGEGLYVIHPGKGADIRNALYRLSSEHNWPLVELKQDSGSLEDIFRNLTQSQKQ